MREVIEVAAAFTFWLFLYRTFNPMLIRRIERRVKRETGDTGNTPKPK